MYDIVMAKIDRLARKSIFVQKKHLKIAYFGKYESGFPDFGGLGRQTVDTRSGVNTNMLLLFLGSLGYNDSN